MTTEKIFELIRKVPKVKWKRSPSPYWTERSEIRERDKGFRIVEYSTSHNGAHISVEQKSIWHTEYISESDWNNADSRHVVNYSYDLIVRKGLKSERLSESGEYNAIHELFVGYLESEVRDYLMSKVEAKKRKISEETQNKENQTKRTKVNTLLSLLKFGKK
jgi:hypothetical protein